MTISAVPTTSPLPGFQIDATGLPTTAGNVVSVWRHQDGRRDLVRGAEKQLVTGSTMGFTDYEAGFGVGVQFSLVVQQSNGVAVQSQESAFSVLDVAQPWLSDPLDPSTALTVVLEQRTYEAWELSRDGGSLSLLNDPLRVAVSGIRHAPANVPLSFLCDTAAQASAVRTVLMNADPFLLRTPADRPGDRSTYYSADKITQENAQWRKGVVIVIFSMTASQVRPPAANTVVPVRTYANVAAEATTYGDTATIYNPDTYLALQRGSF